MNIESRGLIGPRTSGRQAGSARAQMCLATTIASKSNGTGRTERLWLPSPGIDQMNIEKVQYYLRNIWLDCLPQASFRRQLGEILRKTTDLGVESIVDRIDYYNKVKGYIGVGDDAPKIGRISMRKSFYYYDLKEHARYFPRKLRLSYQFGDVRVVPNHPTFVKSRPIHGDNVNALIMKLEKFRHFQFPADGVPFENKRPVAVWRGGEHNSKRVELMRRYRGHPMCDVGYTHVGPSDARHSRFLSPSEQMAYRYIISVEGNDVASNLKWILSSNSLCIMPAPVYETWFMEGRLKAGEHYACVADDFEDLEDKIRYYEGHPAEAREIVRNANRHVDQFLDEPREQLLSLLVMYKYFVATRQIEPDETIAGLI